MASRTYRAEAIVLKTHDFGETDRILTLLTRHFGKVRVVAKGIRKPTSRLAGHAEPLTHATYQLARGRNLDVLTGAESLAMYRELRADLRGIAAGWYIAELADRFSVERSPSAPLFDLVETALRHLSAGAHSALVCRWFDLQLLDRTGFRPELGQCVQCRIGPDEVTNAWIVEAGGLVCARCAPTMTGGPLGLTVRALKSLRYLLVSDFAGAALLRVDESLASELERHLRSFLQSVLDREIHAARLLDDLARLPRPTAVTV
ncbi:MAG TPA: DNA repair protein RecO [Candidatus Limnocylindria bacterium]|nr:DNA repair protein RecO [Candidatus Limnocylindria bacterium]